MSGLVQFNEGHIVRFNLHILDNRSLFLNYEIATFVYSVKQVDKLYSWAKIILNASSKDSYHLTNKRSSLFAESILKILTPLM